MLHIVLICLAYVVGIIWGLYLDVNLGIVLFCLTICMYFLFREYFKKYKINVLILIIFLAGLLYSSFRLDNYISKYSEGRVDTTLKILSLKSVNEYTTSYICKNELGDKMIAYFPNGCNVRVGEKFQVEAIYEKPSNKRNTGGFDYSRYVYSQNIFGILEVESIKDIYFKETSKFNLIQEIQNSIRNTFEKILPQNEIGIIVGMLIGDTSYIDENTEKNFEIAGITHLLAVSGSNISYIILFTKFLFDRLVGKKFSNYIVIFFLLIFMLVAGTGPSVIRATIMGVIIIFADIISRKPNVYASISVSALIILIYNPLSIFDVGFVLSFGGTLGIVLFYNRIRDSIINKFCVKNKFVIKFVELLSVTLSAQIVLTPIMCYVFNTLSLISIFANILIVPISGILTILGFVTYIIGLLNFELSQILGYSIFVIVRVITIVARIFANLPYASITVITPKFYWMLLYYLIVCKIIFKIKNKHLNYLIYILICFAIIFECYPQNYLEVNFIDVGQGDATYIETKNNKVILIDGGGSENSDYDVGENILVPYILDKHKNTIDLAFISHMHEDHAEGIITAIEKLRVKKVAIAKPDTQNEIYKKLVNVAEENNTEISIVHTGQTIEIDGVRFNIIYPSVYDNMSENENNNSLVIKLEYEDVSILFTGDIEEEGENKLNRDITSNILKVSHHGSKSSTTENFLKQVKPYIAIIGVGKNNSFGHPNSDVLERLQKEKSIIYRTDVNGEISFKIKDGIIKVDNMYK